MIDCESRDNMLKTFKNPDSLESVAKDAYNATHKKNKNGLDLKEFEICLMNFADFFGLIAPEKQTINKEFKRFDINKNGLIEYEEFKNFVAEIITKILFN